MGTTSRTFVARLVCGLILAAMGAVPLIINWEYLFSGDRDDLISAALSVAAGLVAVGSGIYLLAGPRSRGKPRILAEEGSRHTYAGIMFAVCTLLLVGALFVQHPSVSTGLPGLLLTTPFLRLFVSEDSGNR